MEKTFTPVFSWIPTKLHSCQTYQHHHWPSTHVPWHHITLLHRPLHSFFASIKHPVTSRSLPAITKEHTPKGTSDPMVQSHLHPLSGGWGKPLLEILTAHTRACTYAPACSLEPWSLLCLSSALRKDGVGSGLLPTPEIQSVHPPVSGHKPCFGFRGWSST